MLCCHSCGLASIRKLIVSFRGAVMERVGRAGLQETRVFLMRVSFCVCVSNYRAENTPHSFRPRWRAAVPGSEGKQEREYFLDTGARFLDFDFGFCCFLWNRRAFGTERAPKKKLNVESRLSDCRGLWEMQTLHTRRNEYVGYILVPWVKLASECAENKRCALLWKNGNS